MLIVNLFDKNIELFIAFADKKWGEKENLNISDTFLWLNALKSLFFGGDSFMISNIVLYLIKKLMSKTQAKKLSLKFVPYFFIAVTILTTFGSNSVTWAWTNPNLMD